MRSLLSFLAHRAEKTEVLSDDLLQVCQSLTRLWRSGQLRAARVVRAFVVLRWLGSWSFRNHHGTAYLTSLPSVRFATEI